MSALDDAILYAKNPTRDLAEAELTKLRATQNRDNERGRMNIRDLHRENERLRERNAYLEQRVAAEIALRRALEGSSDE